MEEQTHDNSSTSDKTNSTDDELESLSKDLAEKELELSTLERELSLFELTYARTVGILFAELDDIEKEIAKELFRLNPKEEYRQGFNRAERKAKSSRDAVDEKVTQEGKKPFKPSDELRNLFRKVAKTIHPDMATDPEERAYRNTLMMRANEAYKNGDLDALNQILEEWEHRDQASCSTHTELSLFDQMEQQKRQIKARIKELIEQISELKRSEFYQLMIKVERAKLEDRDLLGDMAKDLKEKIIAARKLLESLQQKE